ncbi:MAG: NAD(P)-dependent alcohol dehydrogenase [Pseudomonadota bacterium]
MKIQGAVLEAPGQPLSWQTLELDDPGPDEVSVRVTSVGICHTDIGIQAHHPLPAVLGHEGSGIVEQVGSAVTNLTAGDRVVLTFGSCGDCRNCHADLPSHCFNMMALNFSGLNGAGETTLRDQGNRPVHGSFFSQSSFATHALANERNAIRMPREADHVLLAPLGCGVQTGVGAVMNTLKATAGASIVVIGVGAVGLSAVMGAALLDLDPIIAIDIRPERLALAREMGATHTLESSETVLEAIVDLTGGGADFSFDTAGTEQTFHLNLKSLRQGGHGALAAIPNWMEGFHFFASDLALGRTLSGVLEGSSRPHTFIPQLYEWIEQGRLPVEKMIRTYPAAQINEALRDLEAGTAVKPVLVMDES